MAGDPEGDALRRDTSPGRTGSRAVSSSTNQPQETPQRGRPIPQQNPSAVPAHESKEEQNATGSMAVPPSKNTKGPKAFSWAEVAAGAKPVKESSTIDPSRGKTPSRATNPIPMRHPPSGRVAPSGPTQADETREQDTTSMPPSRNPNVSEREVSGPRYKITSLPQTDSSKTEADIRTEHAAEKGRLQEMKSYLRELTEAHDLPRALMEHLSDEESETTPETIDALFKDFASRLSKEYRGKEENLQSAQAKLEMSTSAQATLEKEKLALEEVTKMKDAKLEELKSAAQQTGESNVEDLKAQIKDCAIERDEAISELGELRKKLEAAESERNEKEISLQKLNIALEEARQSDRQADPSVDVDALRITISDLRKELRDLKSDKAGLERQYERDTDALRQKDNDRAADMIRQDEFFFKLQEENAKYRKRIEALQCQKEKLRKTSEAEAKREPVTFRVDNKILSRDKYEKLLDNVRGDMAKLEEQLQKAEEERERAIRDVDGIRQMVMEEFVPRYALAVDEAAQNMFNTWAEEDARLMALAGEGGYHRYLHAIVEPDNQISQISSEAFDVRGETAAGLGLDGSESSEPTSPPVRQNLETELGEFSRESSISIEDTLIGHGDGSAELVKALDECQIHLKKADQRVEELESETKKQQDELEALQDENQKLKEAAEVAKLSADGSAELQKALGEIKEANQKIKELKDKTKKQEEGTEELQAEIQKLKAAAETSREGSVKLHGMLDECQRQRNEAAQRIKELKGETKKQEDEIKELKDEMQKLKEVAATAGTSRGSGEEPGASECGDQTPKQAVTEHEDAAKRDGQGLQGASAGELRDMQANLNECQAHRKQADREIERLKGEARRRSRELRKLKDNQSLQQRLDELHKDQIGAVQAEASKAKARVRWAETRVALQAKGAGDEQAIFSSAKDSEDYLKLISTLSQRVEESENRYGRAHQELADVRTKATILRATIEQLDSQRNQLEQDRQQLYEKLRARRHSEQDVGQANAALEEEVKNEELREMDGDIEETNEVIRKTKEELAKMDKELQELSKALEDCRAHDKTLMEELAALNECRDGESEDDNNQDDDPQKEIDRLEDEVADLQRQLSKANFNASNEAARRREVEDHGVWEGTRAAALKSKQTELDNMKKENEELLTDLDDLKKKYKKSQTELDNLKKEFKFAVESYEGELELGVISDKKRIEADKAERERIKLHHRHIVGELEARLRKAEEESRGHASEIARVKSEHRVPIDEVEAQRRAGRMRFPFPLSESLKRKGPEPMGTIRLPRHAKTGGWPYEVGPHGPLWEYLVAYFALKESIKPLELEDTALRDYLLRIVDKLDQEVARRTALSRSPMASETRAPSRPKTPGSPTNDSARSSSPGDQVPNSPNDEDGEDGEDKEDENEENEEDEEDEEDKEDENEENEEGEEDEEDKEDERTATLRGIRETCKALEELRPRKQRFLDKEASAVQLIVAFEAEIEALRKRVDGADDSDEMTARPEDGNEEASDDESDNDKTDPAAMRRRIARLRKKVNRTKTNLAKDEKALRSAIEEHEADLAEWVDDLDTFGNDPEGTLYRYLANGAWLTAQAARWNGSTYERPIPLPSFEVIEAMAKRPPNGQKQNLGVDGLPEPDALIDNGDLDNPSRHQKPQEALVRLIQEKLASLRSYTDGCKQDLDRITGVMVASEPTSVASGDLSGDNDNPNRIPKSGIPETVLDALSQWKATVDKILDKMEMLQGAVEGLIDAGVSLGDYECLRVRVRRLRKDLADAAAANADLKAKLSEGSVEGTNSELQEMIKTLKHENDSLREQSHAADQAIKDRAAQEERQRQLEKELIATRARMEVEEIKNKKLVEDKEQLEKAVERMENHHHNTSDGEGSDGSDSNIRSGWRCTCPCVGLCGAPVNPVFDSLPAGAQNIVRNLSRVYTQYRSCCGKSGPGASATAAAAAAAAGGKEEEDDGLLLWRLLGVMRGDSDIREQMQNEGRHYATRLLLAFRGCAWVHFLSWRQTAWWWVGGLWYYATFFLPAVGRRKPGLALVPPPPPPPPKRVAIVVKDMLLLGLLYYTYRVLAATWAVQRVWEMANGYTRAYFVERALHPERSTWLGLGGVDMRLPGFASEPGTAPFRAAVGDGVVGWLGRS